MSPKRDVHPLPEERGGPAGARLGCPPRSELRLPIASASFATGSLAAIIHAGLIRIHPSTETDVHPRAEALIRALDLKPHPEGGWYREIFRGTRRVQPFDARPSRNAMTLIYFLLAEGAHSRWHRVASDEAWTWVEGDALELLRIDAALTAVSTRRLAAPGDGAEPAAVIAAGDWQAARTTGEYTLVTCAVGPGFDFADFTMMSGQLLVADYIRRTLPDAAPLI